MSDRAKARGRSSGVSGRPHAPAKAAKAAKQPSEARVAAQARKNQRDARMRARTRASQLRVAAVVIAVVGLLAGCVAIYSSSLFAITSVEVVGNSHVSTLRIRQLAAVPSDATLIRFPAAAVAARVEADPWVASVTVSRVFPHGMRIRVTERVPTAIVDAGTSMWLADGTGMIIAKPTTETSASLPVVRDVPGLDPKAGRITVSEPLLNALRVLTGISRDLAATVQSVSAPSVDETTLIRKDKIEIVVGEAIDLATKSSLAQRILSDQKGKVVSIDVRITDRPTWRGLK